MSAQEYYHHADLFKAACITQGDSVHSSKLLARGLAQDYFESAFGIQQKGFQFSAEAWPWDCVIARADPDTSDSPNGWVGGSMTDEEKVALQELQCCTKK